MNPQMQGQVRELIARTRDEAAVLDRIGRARLVESLVVGAHTYVTTFVPERQGLDGPESRGLARLVDAARHHARTLADTLGQQDPARQPRGGLVGDLVGLSQSLTRAQRARLIEDLIRVNYEQVKNYAPEGQGLDGRDGPERRGLAQLVDEATDHRHKMGQPERPGPLFADTRATAAPLTQPSRDVPADDDVLWRQDPTEAHQQELRRAQPGDDAPIDLTAAQAEKCLSIVQAYLDDVQEHFEDHPGDQSLWTGPVRDVVHLLSIRALTAKGIPHAADDPWAELDALPWPPPPGLRSE